MHLPLSVDGAEVGTLTLPGLDPAGMRIPLPGVVPPTDGLVQLQLDGADLPGSIHVLRAVLEDR